MSVSYIFKRQIRICYWNSEKRHVGAHKAVLERQLSQLAEIVTYELSGLDDPQFSPCDLLVISAGHVPDQGFCDWLRSVRNQLKSQNKISVPTLILSDVPYMILAEAMEDTVKGNWYFDVIHGDHLSSMPVRIANLLRIHDHLHELRRYDEKYKTLQSDLKKIEKELTDQKKRGQG